MENRISPPLLKFLEFQRLVNLIYGEAVSEQVSLSPTRSAGFHHSHGRNCVTDTTARGWGGADGLRCPVCIERLTPHAWDSAGGRQSSSASARTTGDPGADLRSLRWPETAERFTTDMLNMMALRAASPPSEQALGGRVRCHVRGSKLNHSA